ncbi:sigma-70 family RNA polymerase sigma factor [Nocardioides sp. InS609-2]|uniref:sigma-70 family RNA polymerase sigma factor n=1 Tax=Nocardioides sp. InS609-2 TaxID=2760705 RepID=UPI0017BC9FCA|nr:sigma-70 family RNA polymerase sigma factor [Nocardioides sp. InS609-2]MBA3781879.1 sigma-70 family RNA polymerase sigma factor [Nocardioides sp.]
MTILVDRSRGAQPSRAERSALTHDLFARLHADPAAPDPDDLVDQIVRLNLRIATAVAARYRGRGVDEEDLQQAASHGLVKAVLNFDPAHGKDFLTYAVPTIRGEVQRYFRDYSWTVRPPRRIQELQWHVSQCVDRLSSELGREPTEEDVLADLDIGYAEYAEAVSAYGSFRPPSIDQPVADLGGLTVGEALADSDNWRGAVEARLVLAPLLRGLTERERRILHLRFVEELTQQQIGDEYGVAQMQVSRWLSGILQQLRDQLEPDLLQAG